jgi:hypothetical protein
MLQNTHNTLYICTSVEGTMRQRRACMRARAHPLQASEYKSLQIILQIQLYKLLPYKLVYKSPYVARVRQMLSLRRGLIAKGFNMVDGLCLSGGIGRRSGGLPANVHVGPFLGELEGMAINKGYPSLLKGQRSVYLDIRIYCFLVQ